MFNTTTVNAPNTAQYKQKLGYTSCGQMEFLAPKQAKKYKKDWEVLM